MRKANVSRNAETSDMNYFDRKAEMCHGLETDYARMIYYDIPNYYQGKYRSYEYHRICTILDGSKNVHINSDEVITYDKNEFLILPPKSSVQMEISSPTRAVVIELSDILIDRISKTISEDLETISDFSHNPHVYRDSFSIIGSEMTAITATVIENLREKEFLIDLYAQQMTYKLLKRSASRRVLEIEFNNPVFKTIQLMKKYDGVPLTLAEIANAVSISPALLSIKFKKITGMTPNKYYTIIKLNKAKSLLNHLSVTDVAMSLGYLNISHFIRLFKNHVGATPKQYQLEKNLSAI